jgi:hypothetical protein
MVIPIDDGQIRQSPDSAAGSSRKAAKAVELTQPKTAVSRFPPLHRADLEGHQRVNSARPASALKFSRWSRPGRSGTLRLGTSLMGGSGPKGKPPKLDCWLQNASAQ